MQGQEKKMKARRLETLHDTTLCKEYKPKRVFQETDDAQKAKETQETPETKAANRMLQIDIQRWLRKGMQHLRENAPVESPCNYSSAERIAHRLLSYLACPIWHDDQLHLAEWQCVQQLEYLFNLTHAVDAKHLAIEEVQAHKKTAASAEPSEFTRGLHAADDDQFAAIAESDASANGSRYPQWLCGSARHR